MKLPPKNWRSYSSLAHLPAKTVRSRFLEYFIEKNEHQFVKPIPVASYFDHSTDLIYSGACQFSKILTDEECIDQRNVANVQKCVKINKNLDDLETLYDDPHKLLFFEMMSNHTFDVNLSDKKESCRLAWNLLTSPPFSISPSQLFVSFFNGHCENLDVRADEDVRTIWLELGVPVSQILPCDFSSNFWQLGSVGPCGTSTKIFFSSPKMPNLLELWNIGFVKYSRIDDVLRPLPYESVSAGLGLERLTSVLQQTDSVYHIDLFEPLFSTIQKISGAPGYEKKFVKDINLNARYRQLADLCRTITVAVTDDVFPDTNHKMKRTLRKALYIARTDFKQQHPHHMLMELSARVVETLRDTYPELGESLKKVQLIIENEENIIQDVIKSKQSQWVKYEHRFLQSSSFLEYPETSDFYRRIVDIIIKRTSDELPVSEISQIYRAHGIPRSALEKIFEHFGLKVDWGEMNAANRENNKNDSIMIESVDQILLDIGIVSNDSWKHNYERNGNNSDNPYTFPNVEARLLAIINDQNILSVDVDNNNLPDNLKNVLHADVSIDDQEIGLVFDRTNFACGKGDYQCFDTGFISFDDEHIFKVNRVRKNQQLVIHYGELLFNDGHLKLKASSKATLSIDVDRRLTMMRYNTLSHLLFSALEELFPVVYLKFMTVTPEYCQLKTSVLGKIIDSEKCGELIEKKVLNYVERKLPVRTKNFETRSQVLQQPNILYHPNLIYPHKNLRVVVIEDENQKEICQKACDKVHVFNTGDIGAIMVPRLICLKHKHLYVTGILGETVMSGKNLQNSFLSQMAKLQDRVTAVTRDSVDLPELLRFSEEFYPLSFKIARDCFSTPHLITRTTYAEVQKIRIITSQLSSRISEAPRETVVETLRSRIKEMASKDQFVVYFCMLPIPFLEQLSFIVDVLYSTKFPALFFCYYRNRVKGVCHVPEHIVNDHFNAEVWMKSTIQGFDNKLEIKEEVDNSIFCYLKGELVKRHEVINYIESLTVLGEMVAEEHIHSSSSAKVDRTLLQDRS